jgi:GNAT superfamily N-acetyltransferase
VIDGQVVFASIPGVAIGRGSVTEGQDGTRWLGLTALQVAEGHRRRGHGRRIWAAVAAWGAAHGATRGYAVVPAADPSAFAFFEAAGLGGQHRTGYIDARSLGG